MRILAWRVSETEATPTTKSKRKLRLLIKRRRSLPPEQRRALAAALWMLAEQAVGYAKRIEPPRPKLVRQRITAAEEAITKAAGDFRGNPWRTKRDRYPND